MLSTLATYIPYLSLALTILLFLWVVSQELRLRRFFAGKNGRSLEETMGAIVRHLGRLEDTIGAQSKSIDDHEERLGGAIRFVKTVRFNPWEGAGEGGNQSFVTVFLDEKGNGATISTLYTRERTSVYGKPIIAYASQFPLTKEETAVITEIQKLKPKIENKS